VATLGADVESPELAIDGDTAYVLDGGRGWWIEAAPIAGGLVSVIASGAVGTFDPGPEVYAEGTGWMVWGIPNLQTPHNDPIAYGPTDVHVVCD
jgi:hypothetical protein